MNENQVKSILQRHERNKALAAVLEEKARHMRSVLYGPAVASPSLGGRGSLPKGLDDRLAKVEQLEEEAERLKTRVHLVELALTLLDEEERQVAEFCFIRPKSGNGKLLCEVLHKERTAVFRLSKKVLAKLAGVLGAAESEETAIFGLEDGGEGLTPGES